MRNEFLLAMAFREEGEWQGILNEVKKKRYVSQEEIHECYAKVKGNFILFNDDNYPEKLKNVIYPPFVMFTHGNQKILEEKSFLAVVGSRNLSPYGKKVTEKIVGEVLDILPDTVIVSGLALGADETAMRVAMGKNAKIIGVSGAGIESIYPSSSQDIYDYCKGTNGLLISEYPSLSKPDADHFPMRNRILVGLCDALLVVEGEEKSGTSISVGYGIDQGKTVMAIPRNIDDSKTLTNKLIKDGAESVLSGKDVVSFLKDSCW